MNIKKMMFIILLIGVLMFYGCESKKNINDPVKGCIELCKELKGKIDLSNGPCLSDAYSYEYDDWVCDVAHWPRQPVDNLPENQCREYREGKAHHFVEVNPNCNFIRKY